MRLWISAICIAFLSAAQPGVAQSPIRVTEFERATQAGPVRGLIAVVDLADPSIEVLVTRQLPNPAPNREALPTATDEWARSVGAVLAVNANFFARAGDHLDIIGLCVSDGALVSSARDYREIPDPALVFEQDGTADIRGVDPGTLPPGVFDAVAGVGGSDTAPDLGTFLVTDGAPTGETARVQPFQRHPRTAAGLTADGERLILTVIDGRQPAWSVGMTLPELADLMVEFGAFEAINLDGGGSSSFVYRDPETNKVVQNRPSDGQFRGVACHLGFRFREGADAPDREAEQARGHIVVQWEQKERDDA